MCDGVRSFLSVHICTFNFFYLFCLGTIIMSNTPRQYTHGSIFNFITLCFCMYFFLLQLDAAAAVDVVVAVHVVVAL